LRRDERPLVAALTLLRAALVDLNAFRGKDHRERLVRGGLQIGRHIHERLTRAGGESDGSDESGHSQQTCHGVLPVWLTVHSLRVACIRLMARGFFVVAAM